MIMHINLQCSPDSGGCGWANVPSRDLEHWCITTTASWPPLRVLKSNITNNGRYTQDCSYNMDLIPRPQQQFQSERLVLIEAAHIYNIYLVLLKTKCFSKIFLFILYYIHNVDEYIIEMMVSRSIAHNDRHNIYIFTWQWQTHNDEVLMDLRSI